MFKQFFPLAFLLVLLPVFLVAQEDPQQEHLGDTLVTNADLFAADGPLEMTLRFNLKKYQKDKNVDKYMDVDLSISVNDSLEIRKEVRVKARGNFRKGYCSFAPFWLNIRKADVKNPHLQGVRRIKIVTHCNGVKSYQPLLMKEYLVYKIYELLSPVSFRTRLIRITYIDTGRKDKLTKSYAFMIEPEEMLAERLGGVVMKNDQLGMAHMRREEMTQMANFLYMVGNSDYSIVGRHNVKFLGLGKFGKEGFTPVPYDFDYSGFVNAHYAVPGPDLGIKSVVERYYLGPCREPEEYRDAINALLEKKQDIQDLLMEFPFLSENEKSGALKYLERYYLLCGRPGFLEKEFRRTCR